MSRAWRRPASVSLWLKRSPRKWRAPRSVFTRHRVALRAAVSEAGVLTGSRSAAGPQLARALAGRTTASAAEMARVFTREFFIFGSPADSLPEVPLALRTRLTAGVPFSDAVLLCPLACRTRP